MKRLLEEIEEYLTPYAPMIATALVVAVVMGLFYALQLMGSKG